MWLNSAVFNTISVKFSVSDQKPTHNFIDAAYDDAYGLQLLILAVEVIPVSRNIDKPCKLWVNTATQRQTLWLANLNSM
jgi:hypothetical protein